MRVERRLAPETVVPSPNNLPYLVVISLMSFLAVIFVLGISYLRPTQDNGQMIATLLGFIATTTASVLAFMKAQETHLSVNSRLDAFMANAKIAAHAEGKAEGKLEGQEAANRRSDQLAAAALATHDVDKEKK